MIPPITLERALPESSVRVSEKRWGRLVRVQSVPFGFTIEDGEIHLRLPYYASLRIQDGAQWRSVHNGRTWGALGVRTDTPYLDFKFPLHSRARVDLFGRSWRMDVEVPGALHKRSMASRVLEQRFFGYSVLAHASLFIVLWAAATGLFLFSGVKPVDQVAEEQAKKASAKAAGGAAVAMELKPFQGMTFTAFSRKLEQAKLEADPLGYLAKSLGRKDMNQPVGKGVSVQSATGAIGQGLGKGTGNSALTDAVSSQKFLVQPGEGGGSRVVSEKQQLALREKFKDLQDDFKRIYSRLLADDPALSVTVAFQTRVQPSGYLELSDFKARGNYDAATLGKLKSAMADVIRSVFVGAELSGLTLRAENVFVR